MLTMIILVTSDMKPVPEEIRVNRDFGREVIRCDDGITLRGDAMAIQAEPGSLRKWLRPCNEVCITDRPVSGPWHIYQGGEMQALLAEA